MCIQPKTKYHTSTVDTKKGQAKARPKISNTIEVSTNQTNRTDESIQLTTATMGILPRR